MTCMDFLAGDVEKKYSMDFNDIRDIKNENNIISESKMCYNKYTI